MTEAVLGEGPLRAGSPLRTPRAAAVAGIIFSALLITALVLLRLSTPEHPGETGAWLTDSRDRAAVAIALNLVPFAGIAFLWFIGVLRDRIGEREDRFFATVFLGSGLLFVAMMFAAAAVSGGLIADVSSGLSDTSTLSLAHNITMSLLNVYAMRMAAVFTLTTVTIARRTEIVSRWLTLAGLVCAVALLIGIGISPWAELVFPAWILALSLDVLAAGPGAPSGRRPARPADPGRLPAGGHPAGASMVLVLSLAAETIEFSVSYASEKGMPFVRRESENRPLGVPAVANPDLAAGQARHFDTVAVGEAQRALDPVRS